MRVIRFLICVCSIATLTGLVSAAPVGANQPVGDTPWYWHSPQPQGSRLNAVCFVSPMRLVAVGANGTIQVSVDGGVTWDGRTSGTHVSLEDVSFGDSLVGWTVGGGDYRTDGFDPDGVSATRGRALLHTTDGGLTWTARRAPLKTPLGAVATLDSTHAWIGGSNGYLARTGDAGATWTRIATGTTAAITCIEFSDSTHAIAGLGDAGFLRTTDGGLTWRRRRSALATEAWSAGIASAAFDGAATGYAILDDARTVARTTDAGRSWTPCLAGDWSARWSALAVDGDGTVGVAGMTTAPWSSTGGSGARVCTSGDGGATWTSSPAGPTPLHGLALGGGAACAVGRQVATALLGAAWQPRTPSAQGFATLDMVADSTGVALGSPYADDTSANASSTTIDAFDRQTVYRTTDGGAWRPVSFIPRDWPATGIDFVDPLHGWVTVSGNGPTLTARAQGGEAVARLLAGAGARTALAAVALDPTAVATTDDARGTDSSPAGVGSSRPQAGPSPSPRPTTSPLLETTDGGVTWIERSVGVSPVDLEGIEFADASHGWAWGADVVGSIVCTTTDAGITWQRRPVPARPVVTAEFMDDQSGWVGTVSDRNRPLLRTTDTGVTWHSRRVPSGFWATVVFDVDFVDADTGYAVGAGVIPEYIFSLLWKTTDGGSTWTVARLWWPEWALMTRCAFSDSLHGSVFGEGVWSTDDGGTTWSREVNGFACADVARSPSGAVWAAGPDGLLASVDGPGGDTTPPATFDDGDRDWHRPPLSLTFSAADYGGGPVARTEFRLDDATTWSTLSGDTLTFDPPPGDRSLEGTHRLFYRSVDPAGNVEPAHVTTIRFDTTRPQVLHLPTIVARTTAWFCFRVYDVTGSQGTATIRIYRAPRHRAPARLAARIRGVPWTDGWAWAIRRLSLAPGRYSYSVVATDCVGNVQAAPAHGDLVVPDVRPVAGVGGPSVPTAAPPP